MSSLMLEMQSLYEFQNIENIDHLNISDYSDNVYKIFSNISKISKSDFGENFHFLCKKCHHIPKLKFYLDNKINYKCKCKEEDFSIKEIFSLLLNSEDSIEISEILLCNLHPNEKYLFYCQKCKKKFCIQCLYNRVDQSDHEHKMITNFDLTTIKKTKYIIDIINKKKANYINIENEDYENNSFLMNSEFETNNNFYNSSNNTIINTNSYININIENNLSSQKEIC